MSIGLTPPALPRLDGRGVLNRMIRKRFEAEGMSRDEAIGWTKIYARALRGECWLKDSWSLLPGPMPFRVPAVMELLLWRDQGKWTCTSYGHQFLREVKTTNQTKP